MEAPSQHIPIVLHKLGEGIVDIEKGQERRDLQQQRKYACEIFSGESLIIKMSLRT